MLDNVYHSDQIRISTRIIITLTNIALIIIQDFLLLQMRKSKSLNNINNSQKISSTQKLGNYQFINKEYSRFLKCSVCKQLMSTPTRLHPCAHTFCLKCAPKAGKCPSCHKNIVEAQTDLIGLSLVNEMTVRCLNDGCPFKASFEEYKKFHQNSCKLEKGLEDWLRKIKGTLEDNSNQFSRPKNSSDEQEARQETQIKIASLVLPKNKLSKARKQMESNQDQRMFLKNIKRDLE